MADRYKYGVAVHLYKPIVKRGVVDLAVGADWTPAAGDVKISKDGGAAANVTNLPTAIAMGNTAYWDYSITATEMQAAHVVITVADSATKAVEDTMFEIATYGNASAQELVDYTDGVRMGLTGLANAVPGAAGGLFIAGTNAPVTITGSGDALTLTSSGGNGAGIKATGNGSGEGISATGGATGHGIEGVGGATSGAGIKGTGSTNAAGIQADGAGTGDGMKLSGGATGHGLEVIGGGTSGDGLKSTVTSGVPIRGDITANVTGNLSGSVASVTAAVAVTSNIKKNQALAGFTFVMVLTSDHVTPATGLTVVVQRSINGGAFANATNTPATEIGTTGAYTIDLSAADLNGNNILFKMTSATADTRFIQIETQP